MPCASSAGFRNPGLDPLAKNPALKRHCQLNEKSPTDPFLVRKADGVQAAKIEALVKAENQR
jgi:hypothetical protein